MCPRPEQQKWISARDQILCGLVSLLPEERVWTQEERDRWLDLLHRVIDFTIAVVPASVISEEADRVPTT